MFASKNIYIVGAIAVLLIICTAIHQAIAFPTEDEAFARNLRASKKLPFAFGDVVATNKFPIVRSFNGKWISGNEFVFKNDDSNIIRQNVATNTQSTFFNADILNQWNNPTWTLSPDNKKLLIRHNVTQIFRHSFVASYAIYDIESKQVTDIADKALLSLCIWSPNAQHIVYVLNNDVYFLRSLQTTRRLTEDGIVGIVYNGVPDWVYEEEVFGSAGAIWVAPNGARLVIASFDDKAVREFTYNLYSEQYETEVKLRYPKVGTKNPIVSLRHIDLDEPNPQWKVVEAPVGIVTDDHILQSVSWIDDATFGSIWTNRRQNQSVFQQCHAPTNNCRLTFQNQEPNGWIDISAMKCIPSGERCFYIDYIDNWRNIYEYIVGTGVRNEYIVEEFTVLAIYGFNVAANEIYYLATTKSGPHQRHVYKNRECLTCQLRDNATSPDSVNCAFASASFSKDLSYYAVTCSGPSVPYTMIVQTANPSVNHIAWETNSDTRESLKKYDYPRIQFLRVPVGNGHSAAVKLYLPSEVKGPTPMVVDVYGGPNSVRVQDDFSLGYKQFLITSRNVIYCQIDGRGSGNKGKKMLFEINNRMGTVEIEDQIEVTRYLQRTYDFIDANRTAIWGWSYGGYATAHVLEADRDAVFQCGISVAPVASWIYYDSIYTERYMGLPTAADNWANYESSDVSRNLTTNALRKHKYMLIHGNADDNVHYQNALLFTDALVRANVDFEQVSYPNENHGLGGVQKHLYHTIDRFWVKCLNLTTV